MSSEEIQSLKEKIDKTNYILACQQEYAEIIKEYGCYNLICFKTNILQLFVDNKLRLTSFDANTGEWKKSTYQHNELQNVQGRLHWYKGRFYVFSEGGKWYRVDGCSSVYEDQLEFISLTEISPSSLINASAIENSRMSVREKNMAYNEQEATLSTGEFDDNWSSKEDLTEVAVPGPVAEKQILTSIENLKTKLATLSKTLEREEKLLNMSESERASFLEEEQEAINKEQVRQQQEETKKQEEQHVSKLANKVSTIISALEIASLFIFVYFLDKFDYLISIGGLVGVLFVCEITKKFLKSKFNIK